MWTERGDVSVRSTYVIPPYGCETSVRRIASRRIAG
jgi:hypothetical protein